MKRIIFFGASTVYGVGGKTGGVADLLKQKLHRLMYGKNGIGEQFEVYNFSKPGATIEFVLKTYPDQLKYYAGDDALAVVSVGGNDAKADSSPTNFISAPENYKNSIKLLLKSLKQSTKQLIAIGFAPVNEQKTCPKISPFTGRKSYFTNQRLLEFNQIFKLVCDQLDIKFINIFSAVTIEDWKKNYLSSDGLHPNDNGYRYIFEKLSPAIKDFLLIKE